MQVSRFSCTLHGGVVVDGLSAVLLLLLLLRRRLLQAVGLFLFLSLARGLLRRCSCRGAVSSDSGGKAAGFPAGKYR